MLQLTQNAAVALTTARAESGAPDTYGVRFFTSSTQPNEQARIAIGFVASPEPNDALVEEHGLKAYVAPEVTQVVGDATVDVENVGGQSQLVVRRRPDLDG